MRAGKTVLLTTHYMFEADELCDRIAVIRAGAIVAEGTPAQLKAPVSAGHVLEVEAYGVHPDVVASVRRLAGVRSVSIEEDGQAQRLLVQVDRGSRWRHRCWPCSTASRSAGSSPASRRLEDAYVELVGTSVTDGRMTRIPGVARMLTVTWWLQLKMLSASAFNGILQSSGRCSSRRPPSSSTARTATPSALVYAGSGRGGHGSVVGHRDDGQRRCSSASAGTGPSSCSSPHRRRSPWSSSPSRWR